MDQDWSDLEPIYQKEVVENVIVIHSTDEYREAMGLFRAVVKAEEKSKRALELTSQLLELNPSHYSIWIYRRCIIDALSETGDPSVWLRELHWTHELNLDNLKTYQIWQHRQIVMSKLQSFQEMETPIDTEEELSAIESILEQDNKNYHAWSYRTWLVQTFSLFHGELECIDRWIQSDPLNNSAWHYRYYLVKNQSVDLKTSAMIEIKYALQWIRDYIDNECPWVYLGGWLPFLDEDEKENVMQIIFELDHEKEDDSRSRFVLGLRLAYLEEKNETSDSEEKSKIIKALSEKIDPIRSHYWQYRAV